jgi:hypothetical protein
MDNPLRRTKFAPTSRDAPGQPAGSPFGDQMRNIFSSGHASAWALGLALAMSFSSLSQAEEAHPTRLRGTILSVQGDTLSARAQDGAQIKIKLAPRTRIAAIVPASLASVKPGSFVGITSMPGDGSERIALEVHIFPEALRGTGEGDRPWDKGPGSRMTNATVASVAGFQGQDLTLKFRGGENKSKVTPRTKIVTFVPGNPHDLKPGNRFIAFATLDGQGMYEPRSISIGRDGLAPPM